MGTRKKDSACLNAYIRKDVMSRLEEYCARTGRTKTIVTEWALAQYLESHAHEISDMNTEVAGHGETEQS